MYITRLHVKNLKLMRDLALDFTHEGKPRMWTAFVAENGACKTTLLQTIALAASGPDRANQMADVPSLPDLRRTTETVWIDANFEFGNRLERLRLFPDERERSERLLSSLSIGADQSTFSGYSSFAPPPPDALASAAKHELRIDISALAAILENVQDESIKKSLPSERSVTVGSRVAEAACPWSLNPLFSTPVPLGHTVKLGERIVE
jgi:hypothetical protein